MRGKKVLYIEAGLAAVVLAGVLYAMLPRFRDTQLQTRIDKRKAELRAMLKDFMEYERYVPHDEYGGEAWQDAIQNVAARKHLKLNAGSQSNAQWAHVFRMSPEDSPVAALRVQGITHGVQNHVLWAVAGPVPRIGEIEPFTYDFGWFVGTIIRVKLPGESVEEAHRRLEHSNEGKLRHDSFDVSNGLHSDGVLIVWDTLPVPQPTPQP